MAHRRPHPILAAAVTVGMMLAVAPSEGRTMQQKLEAACAADIVRLCPGDGSDPDRLKTCLLSRRTAVSAACVALVDASE